MMPHQLIRDSYWELLKKLYDREKDIQKEPTKERYYQRTLAKTLKKTEPTISEPLSDLKKMGLVRVEKKSLDRGGIRENLILTDEGKFYFEIFQLPSVEDIKSTIKQLKEELYRYPTVEEIAIKIGKNPEHSDVRDLIYAVGKTIGWHPPDLMKPSSFNQFEKRVVSIEPRSKNRKNRSK